MVITALRCPVCGTEAKTGLPDGSTVKAVAREPMVDPDDPTEKVRQNLCPGGHEFYFRFTW